MLSHERCDVVGAAVYVPNVGTNQFLGRPAQDVYFHHSQQCQQLTVAFQVIAGVTRIASSAICSYTCAPGNKRKGRQRFKGLCGRVSGKPSALRLNAP